jgi:hypothetical protein
MNTKASSSNRRPSTTSQVQSTGSHDKPEGGLNYLRTFTPANRANLANGKLIMVVNHENNLSTQFPLNLFNAASTKKDLVVDNAIVLPEHVDMQQVIRLLSLMKDIPIASRVGQFPAVENTVIDLHFHSAAEALGMASFTQNIFNLYFKRVKTCVAVSKTIEAICSVRTPAGDKIFNAMTQTIATAYFEGKINDEDGFERYLFTNGRLLTAVTEVSNFKEEVIRRKALAKEKHAAFLERQRKRDAKAAALEKREKEMKEKARAERAASQQRTEKEVAVRKSMLDKKRSGQKLTAEESRAHEKLFGKAVPQ